MANLKAIKADANKNAKALGEYLRRTEYLTGFGQGEIAKEMPEEIEVIYNAYLAADDLARRLATL